MRYLILLLVTSCTTPPLELRSPCPNYGLYCKQAPVNTDIVMVLKKSREKNVSSSL